MLNAVYGYLGYQIIEPAPVDFQVRADQDVYETQSLLNRTQKIAWEALSWIVFPIKLHEWICSSLIFPLQYSENPYEQTFLDTLEDRAEVKTLETADGVKLRAAIVWNEEQRRKPQNEQKWIIRFNGNGDDCFRNAWELKYLSDECHANVITINFRGGPGSEGYPTCAQDLYLDAEAAYLYVNQSLRASDSKTVVCGFSLGGGVATRLAANHGLNAFIDRSFSSITDVVKAHVDHIGDEGVMIWVAKSVAKTYAQMTLWMTGFNLRSDESLREMTGRATIAYAADDEVILEEASLKNAAEGHRVVEYGVELGLNPIGHNGFHPQITEKQHAEINRLFRV